jgi:hypothetical protein
MVCAIVAAAQNEAHKTSATLPTLFMTHLNRLPAQIGFLSAGLGAPDISARLG